MPQVSLVNRSGITIKVGDYVKLHPQFKDAFVFAPYWDRELIGNATQQTAPGKRCVINLLNTVSYENIVGAPEIPDVSDFYTKEQLQSPGQAIVDWLNIANPPLFVTTLFLDDTASDISTYSRLVNPPTDVSEDIDTANSSNNAETLIEAYALDTPFNTSILNGGAWHFVTFAMASAVLGTNVVVIRIYERTAANAEIELFNLSTPDLATSVTEYDVEIVTPDFIVSPTSRLVVKYFALSSSVVSRTISLYHSGTVHYTHIHTSFSMDLGGVGGDLVLGETATTAYRGDRGKTAYDHSQAAHAPSSAEQNVNADWNAVSGDAQIMNKPAIPTLLADLSSDTTHRIVTDTQIGNFHAPGSDNQVIPDELADLAGDSTHRTVTDAQISNFHAPSSDNQDLSGKQDVLISATNIKTINGSSVLGSGDLTVTGGLTQQQILRLI